MDLVTYRRVAVIGSGNADAGSHEYLSAVEVGRGLARFRRMAVVTGGLGGVMLAASRAAAEGGALTLGFLPGTAPEDANPWVRLPVPTGLGEGRNLLVVGASEAVIAVGGGWGTLSEISLARKRAIPVVSVRGWTVPAAGDAVPDFEDPQAAIAYVAEVISLAPAD